MEYYIILFILYFLIGLIEINNKKKTEYSKIFALISLFPLFVLTAFRDVRVGNDTIAYVHTYNILSYISNFKDIFLYSRMEPGYIFINYIFAITGAEYICMQIFISGFIYYSLFRFLSRYSVNIGLSCIIFLGMRMFCGPMNVVRMWIALAILLFALDYFIQSKIYKANILIILAMTFHYSALIFLALNFTNSKLNTRNVIIIILTSVAIALAGKSFFDVATGSVGLYQGYLDSKYFNYDDNIAIYLTLLIDITLTGLYFFLFKIEKINYSKTLIIFVYLSIFSVGLDIIGLTNTIMTRISGYFYISWMILIPIAVNYIKKANIKLLIYCCLAIGFLAQFLVVMIFRPTWNGVVPYVWY